MDPNTSALLGGLFVASGLVAVILMLRVYGSSEKLDSFTDLLRPHGLLELVRSGKVLMARGLSET